MAGWTRRKSSMRVLFPESCVPETAILTSRIYHWRRARTRRTLLEAQGFGVTTMYARQVGSSGVLQSRVSALPPATFFRSSGVSFLTEVCLTRDFDVFFIWFPSLRVAQNDIGETGRPAPLVLGVTVPGHEPRPVSFRKEDP